MDYLITPSALQSGTIEVPGDKSVSHRALMLGSIADGPCNVSGFLAGADCLATLAAFRSMGVQIDEHSPTQLTVHGVGRDGLKKPARDIDCGNAGTAMRLLAGILAGQGFDSTLTGDESLCSRPMARVVDPLTAMGAVIEMSCDGTPPLQIRGNMQLKGIDYPLPMASAQVKSCVLLAGLYAGGMTRVREPAVTRDHTERMLETMGIEIRIADGWIGLAGGQQPAAVPITVPGDLSSATFPLLAALLADDAELRIDNVGINPTRTGVLDILLAMGADIRIENERTAGAEPIADLLVRSSALRGIEVDPVLVPLAIDEFPALFVAAAAASGETRFSGLGELRVKESDRLGAMAAGLRALGIDLEESADGAIVQGGRFSGGEVDSFGDHRIAMAFAVAATRAVGSVRIRDVDNVATSYPGFAAELAGQGIDIREERAA